MSDANTLTTDSLLEALCLTVQEHFGAESGDLASAYWTSEAGGFFDIAVGGYIRAEAKDKAERDAADAAMQARYWRCECGDFHKVGDAPPEGCPPEVASR